MQGVSGPPTPTPSPTSLPISRLAERTLFHSYLPVKSLIPLITGQRLYQQTTSGVFLHAFYTDDRSGRFFLGASFEM